MKAAVLRGIREQQIEEVEIDSPTSKEVVVKVSAAGVCHSDLHFYNGTWPAGFPMVLGHESAGIVEAVGKDVTYVKPGDHVITCLSTFCGHCEDCITGRMVLCQEPEVNRASSEPPRLHKGDEYLRQFARLGSYAEYMLIHEHSLVKIRDDMPLDRAALIGCGVMTGAGAVLNTAAIKPGSTVAVIGCGGVGLSCVNGALIGGASRIIAVDMLESKLKLAREFGATDVVNASETDAVQAVQEMTGGGVHYSFEAIGLKSAAEQAWGMLRRGGTATVIGMIAPGETVNLPGPDFLGEKCIQGSSMGSNHFRVDMPRYVEFYLQGRLHLDQMISQRIKLDQINDAMDILETGDIARSVIVFD
jgi:S-(hydroxymethyl)glutathione dehydrogenase/alcohol dehydrogenase|tara:strand:- start:8750 stop:9829 length:1080 start_codon:yes stop_codon:yes gene_type:complete